MSSQYKGGGQQRDCEAAAPTPGAQAAGRWALGAGRWAGVHLGQRQEAAQLPSQRATFAAAAAARRPTRGADAGHQHLPPARDVRRPHLLHARLERGPARAPPEEQQPLRAIAIAVAVAIATAIAIDIASARARARARKCSVIEDNPDVGVAERARRDRRGGEPKLREDERGGRALQAPGGDAEHGGEARAVHAGSGSGHARDSHAANFPQHHLGERRRGVIGRP